MKQRPFEAAQQDFWQAHGAETEALSKRPARTVPAAERRQRVARASDWLVGYRRLCNQLALARSRGYTSGLVQRLNQRVLSGHWLLHRQRRLRFADLAGFLRIGFPCAVRRHRWALLWASLVFYGPALLVGVVIQYQPAVLHWLLDTASINALEAMYDPRSEHLGRVRADATDVQMFGFYIRNNIGIALQTVATGLIFGLGSLFFLGINGLFLGAAAGHLQSIGYGEPFWTFVIAHGAFELTAITLAGAAGLHLGNALLAPGNRRRVDRLREHAGDIIPLLYGVVVMLLIAAAVEAFWSSQTTPGTPLKLGVGGICWLLVIAYLGLAGRGAGRGARGT